MEDQWLAPEFAGHQNLGFHAESQTRTGFYLAAPKVTNSLVLAPQRIPQGLRLETDGDSGLPTAARRAAVLSATFLLVYRAAKELDVDPDEFEIIEPRTVRLDGADAVLLIQFCDALINGSGLCDRLVQPSGVDGTVEIAALGRSILNDADSYPLKDFDTSSHRAACDQSCYVCLNRFGNQSFHGLLDWRLGMDVLSLLVSPEFKAGLDGEFHAPGLRDWRALSKGYAQELSTIAGPRRCAEAGFVDLACLDEADDVWCAVVHPLWDWNRILVEVPKLMDFAANHGTVIPATSFDLARRPVTTLEALRRRHLGRGGLGA